jgi:putative ABC transport system permease protein
LFKTVLRRMFSNFWMIVCLLLGSILATALVSCIPIYTDGIMQRMLTKDMENYQLEKGEFPGEYQVTLTLNYNYKREDRVKALRYFEKEILTKKIPQLDLPLLYVSQGITMGNLNIPLTIEEKYDHTSDLMYAELGTLSGLEDHITITNGRMYSKEKVDGVIEVIASQQAMKTQNLLLNKEYILLDPSDNYAEACRVKLVGVYTYKDSDDVFWNHGLAKHNMEFMMDYELFNSEFLSDQNGMLTEAQWNCGFDYHSITVDNLPRLAKVYEEQAKWFSKYRSSMDLEMPISEILGQYSERAAQLRNMLLVLTVPVLIMITFYIFMVSQLIVGHDENSINVLKSRGASKSQIFMSYLAESGLIGGVAFIIGPLLGIFICGILGSSNGFMEFVQRTALPVSLSPKVYMYSFGAVLVMMTTMLVPVVAASRSTIVKYKQEKSRVKKAAAWKKFFLDIILLLIAAYGIYRYQQQKKVLDITGISANELTIDPLLFLTSTIFVLGAGLLFLRLYPYFIRFIYWLGRKHWSPVPYISLVQVGRSRGQEQFLMLFIILAISTGLFNANSARTVNKNIEDKIRYSIGADVRLKELWKDNQIPVNPSLPPSAKELVKQPPLRYYEPNFNEYTSLPGVELATKVLYIDNGIMQTTMDWADNINIMGIVPNEFARVAWFRNDLLPHHINEYLNLMIDAPKSFLVSTNLRDKYKLKEGDTIHISWGDQKNYLEGVVYAFVDYWPTFNPNSVEKGKEAPGLIVANLSYIQNKMAVQPYEVWIKKADDATDKQINDKLIEKDLQLTKLEYTDQELVKMKNDALLQGMNGMLTLGFIASMLISLLGFLIYWIISIQDRVLQFGILRAMGMSLAKVIGMLACEQLLVSGAAILIGIVIGGITGDLFIPLLQIMYSSADQVPPFRIMASGADYIKVYAVIGIMISMGFLILWRIISRIKIDQAVKLGED